MARLNPRRLIPATVRPWAPTPEGMPAWGAPVEMGVVFEETAEGTSDLADRGRLLVPNPSAPLGRHARVDVAGRTFVVFGSKKAYARSRSPFVEFNVVDPLPRHLGWTVQVVAMDGGGMDDNNDPLPDTERRLADAVLVPAGSLEPDDRTVDPQSSAQLYLPAGETITSTSTVKVTGSPMPTSWRVVGDPDLTPTRTVVQLARA